MSHDPVVPQRGIAASMAACLIWTCQSASGCFSGSRRGSCGDGRLANSARFDHCLVVSPAERDLLHREDPSLPITVVENGVDARQRPPLDEAEAGNALLFVGVMGYEPNEDAARYFCGRILPLVGAGGRPTCGS